MALYGLVGVHVSPGRKDSYVKAFGPKAILHKALGLFRATGVGFGDWSVSGLARLCISLGFAAH